jgi:alkanesulfonate monooxygenase SsuD/methylene tetrahydromethanopterin reductase-like flavin-dependent oxidoreductase (luciferase family)
MHLYRPHLEEGFRRAGNGKGYHNFAIAPSVPVHVVDDPREGFAKMKPGLALYVGGMGAREKNFHNENVVRLGYGDAAARIQELYLAGRKAEAEAAVPDELCDEIALCGPPARIRERYRAYEDAGVSTLILPQPSREALHLMAEIARVGAAV